MIDSQTLIIAAAWSSVCTVWTVLLYLQRRAVRSGAMLSPLPQPSPDDLGKSPRVCVIIPARNEASMIRSCVSRVLEQDYPNLKLIVVDDRSEDDTAARVAAMAKGDSRVELRQIRTLPDRWLAKSNALWQGTRNLDDAEWLLFLDADAVLHPTAVRTAMAEVQGRNLDVLTLWPRNAAEGFWEHLIIPLCGGIIALWFGGGTSPAARRPFANGQFLLIRRRMYEQVGGHASVRQALIEDIPLAERCAAEGATMEALGGAELVDVRMYDSLGAVCDGWSRIFAGALRSGIKIGTSLLWLLFGSLMPYLLMPVLVVKFLRLPTPSNAMLVGCCAMHLILIHVVSFRFWKMGRCDRRYLWLYPVSVIAVMIILLRTAWVLYVTHAVKWRGIRYTIDRTACIVQPQD